MESNCKNKFNLDHIYCHTNDNNYIRANNSSTPDVLALLKENKHLKAMLLLHLDLIQEQSDQLITKEKLIATLRDENNSLKLRLERMERRSQSRSHKNIEILPIASITTSSPVSSSSSSSSSSGPSVSPTIKVSGSSTIAGATAAIVENYDNVDDKKENIPDLSKIEPSALLTLTSALSTNVNVTQITSPSTTSLTIPTATTTAATQRQHQQNNKYKICDETFPNDSIIGESNGKLISKIVLQRVQIPTTSSPISAIPTDCGSNLQKKIIESQKLNLSLTKQKQSQQKQQFTSFQSYNHNIKDITSSLDINEYQNQMIKNEPESQDILESSTSTTPIAELKNNNSFIEQDNEQMLDLSLSSNLNQRKRKRIGFLTTKNAYYTREWEDERQIIDDTNKEEVEALKAEEPNLEIPKWTIKEFTGLYSIEGTEDLSDDVFLKRHSKLEYDEKRRKKWDVQRIREQRTIERLRRRHYKDELMQQESQDNQEMITFFPTVDQIKFIQVTEDLPIQAFGDCIPRIIPPIEFSLPWREQSSATSMLSSSLLSSGLNIFSSSASTAHATASTAMSSSQQQSFDSVDSSGTTFVFLKRKGRLQSHGTVSSGNGKRPRKSSK